MNDGLFYTNRALDLWVENRGNESTYMQCQRFDGYYWQWAWQGNDSIRAYPSATDAANDSVMFTTNVNDPAITPGDLLYWWWDPYGHVCTAVGWDGGRLLVSNTARMGDTVLALRNGVKISHADTISLRFRGASHTNGRNLPRTGIAAWPQAALGPQQRQGRSDNEARRRQGAPNTSAPQGDPLAANDVGNFQGWVTGESVEGNDLWYVGTSGDFFWSGSFTEVSKHDLPDLNKPKPSAGNQRRAGGDPVNQREAPTTSARTVTQIPPGEVRTFAAWKRGEKIEGNDVWFREASSQLWSWSGGFTDTGTHDLADANTPTPPVTTPPPSGSGNGVDPEWKKRIPDSQLAKWVGSPNFNYREPRPATEPPTHVTMHWMAGTLAGTDAEFQKTDPGAAATYGVGQTEIHQYVREIDYQQADGDQNSNRWGLSIEHEAGPSMPATASVKALSARLLADIATRHGWSGYTLYSGDVEAFRKMPDAEQLAFLKKSVADSPKTRLVFPHKAWASTSCPGTLPLSEIVALANTLLRKEAPPVVVPPVAVPPVAVPPVVVPTNPDDQLVTVGWLKQLFEAIITAVRAFFGSKK